MNRTDDSSETSDDQLATPQRSLLDRLSHALLGEPGTREDLVGILRDAGRRGLFDRDALDMIEGVFQVSEMKVRDIMVPRAQMDVVDKNSELESYLPIVIESGHSRFPMIDGDKDKVVGILLAKDLLQHFYVKNKERAPLEIVDTLRPAVFVPESKRLNVLLREFKANRNHMAIVVDEYGGVAGLVTIEDVLEQIVGEIADEYDIDEDTMIMPRENGESVVKALTPLTDFNAHFHTQFNDDSVDTVGGFLIFTLGRLPKRGEHTIIQNLRFEVLRADSRRVHLLKVVPVKPDRQTVE